MPRPMLAVLALSVAPFLDGPCRAAPDAPPAGAAVAGEEHQDRLALNGEVDLAKLVDLCAQRGGFDVEYDAAAIRGAVTIRVAGELTNDELWALANELLAARGFATVRRPGSSVLSVVKAGDAPAAARLEPEAGGESRAGFRSVLVRLARRDAKEAAEAIRPVLSKPAGSATPVGDAGLLLLTDYVARIQEATRVLAELDAPGAAAIETYDARNLKASELVGLATAAAAGLDEASGRKSRGKPLASPDGGSVVLVGAPEDVAAWRALLEAFDRPPEASTRTYPVRHFAPADVSRLLESSCRDAGPRGSGARWKVVVDDLTGSLVVTATEAEHAAVGALLQRLADTPADVRRQARAFIVRNRPIKEVVDVLNELIDSGAIEAAAIDAGPGEAPISSSASAVSQRTEREPAAGPPAGAGAGPPAAQKGASAPRAPGSARQGRAGDAGATGGGPPPLSITADEGTNSLLVVGEPRLVAQVEGLLRTLDVRQPQVMLEVLVVSLTDDQAVDLGVELRKIEINGLTTVSLSSLFGLGPAAAGAAAPSLKGGTAAVLKPGDFSILVHALETLSAGRTLNIPKVLVTNNQQATLTSVLQEPYVQTNASTTVATTSYGGSEDAGTTVKVKPQISQGDHLILDYSVAISSFVGDSADPAVPPPRQQNTLQSIVEIPDGFTVAVGGLRVEADVKGTSQVPLLGDVPVLGEAFKSRSNTRTDNKFYVFLRASVLRRDGFEDLRNLSDADLRAAGADDGFPSVEPRAIR